MKALSFRQPWAELVLQGRKTMDLRTYNTPYRGRMAIHASQTVESDPCWENDLNPDNLDSGGIVGTVELVNVMPLDEATYREHQAAHLGSRRWREGLYGWVLAHPERLSVLIPARGRTNLFNIELDLDSTTRQPPIAIENRQPARPSASQRQPIYNTNLNGTTPERPFALYVRPVAGRLLIIP